MNDLIRRYDTDNFSVGAEGGGGGWGRYSILLYRMGMNIITIAQPNIYGKLPTISYVQIRTLPLWEAGSVAKDDTDLNANFEIGVGIALNVWGTSSSSAHSDQLSSINSERQFNCTTLQLRAN